MRTSFNGSRSDPRAVVYARATVDLASRDVRIEDVPCRNLEDVLGERPAVGAGMAMLVPAAMGLLPCSVALMSE